MEYILYLIVILFVGCFYAKTAKKLREHEDRIVQLSIICGQMKSKLDENAESAITDYEKVIQQGVENIMGYGLEVAMRSKGDKR